MPKYFHFRDGNEIRFDGELKRKRCQYHLPTGHRCKRNVIIGLPYCFQHRVRTLKVRVAPSTVPNAGTGLFAYNGTNDNEFVFEKNETVAPYYGENVNHDTLTARYGDDATAPYGIEMSRTQYMDAALSRGLGSLTNHQNSNRTNTRFSVARDRRSVNIVATRRIRNNSELFVNYGRQYRMIEPGVTYSTNSSRYHV